MQVKDVAGAVSGCPVGQLCFPSPWCCWQPLLELPWLCWEDAAAAQDRLQPCPFAMLPL